MDQLGMDTIYKYIGREPSGRNFNEIVLDYNGKPVSQLQTMHLEILGLKSHRDILISDTIEQLSNSSPKSKVKTSVLGLGVDFVFPLSQQQQQQQQQQQEQQPPPKSIRRGCTRSL